MPCQTKLRSQSVLTVLLNSWSRRRIVGKSSEKYIICLKFLKLKMPRRPYGDRGVLRSALVEYRPTAHDLLRVFTLR